MLRLVIDIDGVTSGELLAAAPFRLTGANGLDVAVDPVALGRPEDLDNAASVGMAVQAARREQETGD